MGSLDKEPGLNVKFDILILLLFCHLDFEI